MNRNVISTILLVLAVGIYLTFTSQKWEEVKEVRVVNAEYVEAIDNADRLIEVRDEVLGSYNALAAEDRDRLDKMVPNTVDNIRLIIDINSVASRRGLSLKNIKAQASSNVSAEPPAVVDGMSDVLDIPQISTPILDTVTITFNVEATYQQFISLMRDLEANLRLMDLTNLSLTTGTSGTYGFAVELTTYWLREK